MKIYELCCRGTPKHALGTLNHFRYTLPCTLTFACLFSPWEYRNGTAGAALVIIHSIECCSRTHPLTTLATPCCKFIIVGSCSWSPPRFPDGEMKFFWLSIEFASHCKALTPAGEPLYSLQRGGFRLFGQQVNKFDWAW